MLAFPIFMGDHDLGAAGVQAKEFDVLGLILTNFDIRVEVMSGSYDPNAMSPDAQVSRQGR